MKEYLVTVNGKTYEVQVEEIGENISAVNPIPSAPKPASSVISIPNPGLNKPEIKPLSTGAAGKTAIKCPMPGTIMKINVKIGDVVKSGTILCILEAMKMENEILAPGDGVVFSVNVKQGVNVNSGDVLFTIN